MKQSVGQKVDGFLRFRIDLAYEGTDEQPDQWYWFEGNFEAYEANKIERLGPEAAKPHRSKYRRLTRD